MRIGESGRAPIAMPADRVVPGRCAQPLLYQSVPQARPSQTVIPNRQPPKLGRRAHQQMPPPVAVISDMDQTLIPAHDGDLIPKPFSGAPQLLAALDQRAGPKQQNIFYVTARDADSAAPLPNWVEKHGLPKERVESGGGPSRDAATAGKLEDICAIIESQPHRKFILLGDSSHVDAEVYREIALRYPTQIEASFIHDVETISPDRAQGHFVFTNYGQIATELRNKGLLSNQAWAQVVKESST